MKKILSILTILGLSFTLNAFDMTAFEKACKAGNATKCSILGAWHKDQAIKYGNMACDGGFAEGCNHIGDLYNGNAVYDKEAKEAYIKGCNIDASKQEVGVSMACFSLGLIYYNKEHQYEKALKVFKRSCKYGENSACKNVKYICKNNPSICKK